MIVPPRSRAPIGLQMLGDRRQHRLGQLVALEQMAELEDDRLVRDGVTAELQSGERAHRLDVVERLLGAGSED